MKTRKLFLITALVQLFIWIGTLFSFQMGYNFLALLLVGSAIFCITGVMILIAAPHQRLFLMAYEEVLKIDNSNKKYERELKEAIHKVGQHEAFKLVKNKDLYSLVKEVADLDPRTNRSLKLIKLQEELGELSAEFLKSEGYKKTDETAADIYEHEKEEAVDVFLMAADILRSYRMTEEEERVITTKKLEKWKTKHLGK